MRAERGTLSREMKGSRAINQCGLCGRRTRIIMADEFRRANITIMEEPPKVAAAAAAVRLTMKTFYCRGD